MTDAKSLFRAVESESGNGVSDILQNLLEKSSELNARSVVNLRNEQNQTTLHIACSKLHADIAQLLLEVGADPNAQDIEGRTPTFLVVVKLQECNCEDCNKKAIRCLTILAYHGASLDIPNGNGVTPLYLCAESRFSEMAKTLLQNGAALGTARGKPVIEVLMEKIPAVLETVFDRAVQVDGHTPITDPKFELIFDFGVILPPHITLSSQLSTGKGSASQVFPAEKCLKGVRHEPCREMLFLRQLLKVCENDVTTTRDLLRHPLVNVFADIKWKALQGTYLYFFWTQIALLVGYSVFIVATVYLVCPHNVFVNLETEEICQLGASSKLLSMFVLIATTVNLFKEVRQMIGDPKEYFTDVFNYMQLAGFGSVVFTVMIAWSPKSSLYGYLYPISALGVTLSWCQLLVQIGRFPQYSIYVEMFARITVNFLWSLGMYSTVLFGFALSFSILFPKKPQLIHIPLSMIQILMMMTGAINYDDLFNQDFLNAVDDDSVVATSNVTSVFSLQYRTAGHIWFVTFIVFITLALMNLLVGLAVSDIQGIRKNAETLVMRRRIAYLEFLEKSVFQGTVMLPRFMKRFIRERVSVARSGEPKNSCIDRMCRRVMCPKLDLKICKLTLRPNARDKRHLSTESQRSIKYWLNSNAASSQKCTGNKGNPGFKQGNTCRNSSTPFLRQEMFLGSNTSDSDQLLKTLQFNVQQMRKMINELDIKMEMMLKSAQRPDSPY